MGGFEVQSTTPSIVHRDGVTAVPTFLFVEDKLIILQNSIFIDPENCGSSVGYYITTAEYTPKNEPTQYSLSSTVVLADCSHKIDWSFDSVDKIDAAIDMLKEFRKQFLEAEKLVSKLNKK